MMTSKPKRPAAAAVWCDDRILPATHEPVLEVLTDRFDPKTTRVLHLSDGLDPLTAAMTDAGYTVIEARFDGKKLSSETLDGLADFVAEQKPTVVMARRILPELHDRAGADGYSAIPRMLYEAGAQSVISEGRTVSVRSNHPLAKPAAEWKSLAPWWAVEKKHGAIAVLKRGKASK